MDIKNGGLKESAFARGLRSMVNKYGPWKTPNIYSVFVFVIHKGNIKNKYSVYVGRTGGVFRTIDGELHCTTGPAIEGPGGYKEWFINGECLTLTQYDDSFLERLPFLRSIYLFWITLPFSKRKVYLGIECFFRRYGNRGSRGDPGTLR